MTDTGRSDLLSFLGAIALDPTFTPTIRLGLAPLGWFMEQAICGGEVGLIQQAWSDLVSVYSGSWLTSTVQNKILAYATQFNIPLQ